LDHADVIAVLGAETRGNAQLAVRDVVEQFVTGHFGSSLSFGPQGPFTEAVLPFQRPYRQRGTARKRREACAKAAKKGTVAEATVPPFWHLLHHCCGQNV